jgi:hypothetical protein
VFFFINLHHLPSGDTFRHDVGSLWPPAPTPDSLRASVDRELKCFGNRLTRSGRGDVAAAPDGDCVTTLCCDLEMMVAILSSPDFICWPMPLNFKGHGDDVVVITAYSGPLMGFPLRAGVSPPPEGVPLPGAAPRFS